MGDGEGDPADKARMGVMLGRILWMDGGGVLASSGPPAMKLMMSPEDLCNDRFAQAALCFTEYHLLVHQKQSASGVCIFSASWKHARVAAAAALAAGMYAGLL